MALYQGENITIGLNGDEITDLFSDNATFVVLLYSTKSDQSIVLKKNEFKIVDDINKVYYATLSTSTTSNMLGSYTIEIKVKNTSSNFVSIYKQEDAFSVESSRIKDTDL